MHIYMYTSMETEGKSSEEGSQDIAEITSREIQHNPSTWEKTLIENKPYLILNQ